MSEQLRKIGPMSAEDLPSRPCYACRKPFVAGDFSTLLALGPGNSKEARRRSKEGRPYNAICAVLHWECSEGPRQEANA